MMRANVELLRRGGDPATRDRRHHRASDGAGRATRRIASRLDRAGPGPRPRSCAPDSRVPDLSQHRDARREPVRDLLGVAPAAAATPRERSGQLMTDLETRIEDRKRELIAEIVEHKINISRPRAAEAIDKAKARLSELAHIVKQGVVDGWANVSPNTKLKLHEWLAK